MTRKPTYEELEQRIIVFEEEIIKGKQTEAALKSSEEKYRQIFEGATEGIYQTTPEGVYLSVNPAFARMFGYASPQEMIDSVKNIGEERYVNPQDRKDMVRMLYEHEKVEGYEVEVYRKDRSRFWISINIHTVRDASGEILYFEGTNVDITARKNAEDALLESQEYTKLLFHSSIIPQIVMDAETGVYIDCNEAAVKIYGYTSREEVINKTPFDVSTPTQYNGLDSATEAQQRIQACRENGSHVFEWRHQRPNGEIWDADVHIMLFRHRGRPLMQFTLKDITARKKAEDALRQSESILRSVFKTTPVGLCIMKDRVFQSANEAWLDISGYSESEIIGHTPRFLFEDEAEYERVGRELYINLAQSGLASVQTKHRRKNGDIRDVILTAAPLHLDDISLGMALVTVEDITERKRAEDALRVSEERFNLSMEATNDGLWDWNIKTDLGYFSPGYYRMLGYDSGAFPAKGSTWKKMIHPEDFEKMMQANMDCIEGRNEHFEVEYRMKDRNGNWRWILGRGKCVARDERGCALRLVGTHVDITDRKRTEEELRKSRRELADIIEFLPDATLVIDKEGKVIAWNRAIEKMTGVKKEDMLGKGNHEYALPFYGDRRKILVDLALHPDKESEKKYTSIQRVGDVLLGDAYAADLLCNVHLSGTASVLRDNNGDVIAAIECIRDNTERKKLEEQLNRAQKMEALGTLAGGVAHDLNNVLGVLVGYSELMKDVLPENSVATKYAENILQSGIRATAIIQDLLTMARRGVAVSKVVNLNKLITGYLKTPEFENLLASYPNVQITTELADDLFNIKGSPVHLTKTIMNLVSNAAESITGKGKVSIRTKNRYLDQPIHGFDTMQEGDYTVLSISDTGSGISAKDIDKIFEPFYTKKVMGRSGTGLGLAVVWGTVKDHNGCIDVKSKENEGSTFTIYFPVTREEPVQDEKAVSYLTYKGNGETILVVDDVKEQRELAMNILERLGYRVEAVAGGEEAIEYIKSKKADMIVLDMIMPPGIDGLETYRRILDVNPIQKAIIVSGFTETDRVRKVQEMGAGEFVRKPYTIEKIGLAIKKELDRK